MAEADQVFGLTLRPPARKSACIPNSLPNLEAGTLFHFEMPPKSVILRPAIGQHLPCREYCESPPGMVRRRRHPQVRNYPAMAGRSWNDREAQDPCFRSRNPLSLTGLERKETVILSRCTDERWHGTTVALVLNLASGLGAPRIFGNPSRLPLQCRFNREDRTSMVG